MPRKAKPHLWQLHNRSLGIWKCKHCQNYRFHPPTYEDTLMLMRLDNPEMYRVYMYYELPQLKATAKELLIYSKYALRHTRIYTPYILQP